MDLITLVIVVAVIGAIVYLITTRIPMPPGWAVALQVLALVVVVLYLLRYFLVVPNVMPR